MRCGDQAQGVLAGVGAGAGGEEERRGAQGRPQKSFKELQRAKSKLKTS